MTTPRRVVVEGTRKRRQPELGQIRVLVLPDEDPETSFLDQDEFEDRRAQYKRGDFTFVGVRAEAEVVIDGITQHIVSGGLWGVESDAGDAYIAEVGAEEYNDLRQILKTIGVPTDQLPAKADPSWVEWKV